MQMFEREFIKEVTTATDHVSSFKRLFLFCFVFFDRNKDRTVKLLTAISVQEENKAGQLGRTGRRSRSFSECVSECVCEREADLCVCLPPRRFGLLTSRLTWLFKSAPQPLTSHKIKPHCRSSESILWPKWPIKSDTGETGENVGFISHFH